MDPVKRSREWEDQLDNFTYDANGNLISETGITYVYDAENRLVSNSTGAALQYDPTGRLWQVSKAGAVSRLLYDGDSLVAEYDGAGTMSWRYFFGPNADEPIVADPGGQLACTNGTRFLHSNHQGSIVALADCWGDRQAVNSYDEYGIPGSSNQGRFQYTGQAWLPEIGMYHYKARVYSPKLGRFLQTDPIGYDDQVNLYAYVGNDPVNSVDPEGLYGCAKGAASTCKLVNIGLSNLQKASESLRGADRARADGVLEAYGTEGDGNGVVVAQGDVNAGAQTETKNGITTVTFGEKWLTNFIGMSRVYGSFTSVVAHEGVHVFDERNTFGGVNSATLTTQQRYDTEKRAYLFGGLIMGVQHHVLGGYQPVSEPGITRKEMERRAASRAWDSTCRCGNTCLNIRR